jgi:hypothetical protein
LQKSEFYILFVYDDSIPFKVAIDYKGQEFTGINAGEKLTRLIIEMNFEKVGGTWRLTDIEIKDFQYNVSFNSSPIILYYCDTLEYAVQYGDACHYR